MGGWGTEILRYHLAGVYAPISEAGRLHAVPLWNDQEVNYDIGKGPTGVAWDLPNDTSVTFTEILSETPPTGGGGGGTMTSAQYTTSSYLSVPDSTLQPLDIQTLVFNTDTTNYTIDGSGHLVVATAGIYRISYHVRYYPPTTAFSGGTAYRIDGTDYDDQAAFSATGTGGSEFAQNYAEFQLSGGNVIQVIAYQSSGTGQTVSYADLTVSTG